MKINKIISGMVSVAAVLSLSVLSAACGGASGTGAATEAAEEKSAAGEETESFLGEKKIPSGQQEEKEAAQTLAEHLAGRYSYAYPRTEEDAERMEEDMREYYTLDIVNFGGNLFATGGIAMAESPEEEKRPYSFWGMEFIPTAEGALSDTETTSCDIGVLTWSVMSNMGKYWDKPAYGTIELTEEGVAFLGKDGADNPLIEGAERVEFVRDDTVASAGAGTGEALTEYERTDIPGELFGIWKEETEEGPLVVEFAGNAGSDAENIGRLRICRKRGGQRVMFAEGHFCTGEDGTLTAIYTPLGFTPVLETWKYSLEKGSPVLTLRAGEGEYDTVSGLTEEAAAFSRINAEEIPVTGPEALERADVSLAEYRRVLGLYAQAIAENQDRETMESRGLYTGLSDWGVPMASSEEIGYVLYDIDDNGIDECLITWMGNIVDIWSFDGRKAGMTYVTPYRGETVIYDDGMVEMLFGSMTRASNTWYRMDERTEQLLPVVERLYKPVEHGEPDMQYFEFAAQGSAEEFEEACEITKEEYEEKITRGNPAEIRGITLIKEFAGF